MFDQVRIAVHELDRHRRRGARSGFAPALDRGQDLVRAERRAHAPSAAQQAIERDAQVHQSRLAGQVLRERRRRALAQFLDAVDAHVRHHAAQIARRVARDDAVQAPARRRRQRCAQVHLEAVVAQRRSADRLAARVHVFARGRTPREREHEVVLRCDRPGTPHQHRDRIAQAFAARFEATGEHHQIERAGQFVELDRGRVVARPSALVREHALGAPQRVDPDHPRSAACGGRKLSSVATTCWRCSSFARS
jgi:hypothetical protein